MSEVLVDTQREPEYAETSSWPEPLDQAAFYGIAGDVVRIIEPHTEADSTALLIQFLAASGNIIGRGPYYLVEADQHYANIFSVIVGDSAKARKGTSWNRIRALFSGIDDPWSEKSIQSGLSSGEGLLHAVRDPHNDDPGVDDKRLYVAESEFAGLLRVMTRDGNIISRIVRDAWDRGDLGVMTKSCPTRVTGAHISIVGHITSEELARYLDRTESCNGFANRFIFMCARRSKFLPHGGALDARELLPLSQRLAVAIGKARNLGRVRMNAEAMKRWEAVYPKLSDAYCGMLGAVTARAEAQCIRLALIYALLDGSSEIKAEHLRAALAIWKYSEASARYVFGEQIGDPVADTIWRALNNAPQGMTRTEISRVLGRNTQTARISHALELLRGQGRACMEQKAEGQGRPVEIWRGVIS